MSGSPVPSSLLVSFAATPWLVAIVAVRAASQGLERLGLASEEIFRGDRLPILHVSERVVAVSDDLDE